ncbi:hypothetical protein [Marinicellulosiphila megalodicopiae]|uniref:hypothetical protein n=1 Tax=Marinicellulosiphila megalodicopiae TaxID=2724896 RepID=UPI003BAF6936
MFQLIGQLNKVLKISVFMMTALMILISSCDVNSTSTNNTQTGLSIDSDNDGVNNSIDLCPNDVGLSQNNGCPVAVTPIDTDKDGLNDDVDQCPTEIGLPQNNGCPVAVTPIDTDKDGLNDDVDQCPTEIGLPQNNGCPADIVPVVDTDNDGIYDSVDQCPDVIGTMLNNGCPEVTAPEHSCTSNEVKAVFAKSDNNCLFCHSAVNFGNIGGGLDLESNDFGLKMLNRSSVHGGIACENEKLIDPLNADNSLLLKLINQDLFDTLANSSCNNRNPMPLLDNEDFNCVQSWVNDLVDTTAIPTENEDIIYEFEPVSAAEAIMKAKYVLSGAAVTAAEFNQVNISGTGLDKTALKNVIQTWQESDIYKQKIQRFMDFALQQSIAPLNNGYGNIFGNFVAGTSGLPFANNPDEKGSSLMTSNLKSMAGNLAWDLIENDDDFSKIVSTSHWKVTTAILVAFSYIDAESRGERYVDKFARFEHLTPEDYNDWRYVEFQSTATPVDYANDAQLASNMRAIKQNDVVQMRYPRAGFFTMPTFLELWETNEGNKFRVTVNQILISALDATFFESDATAHSKSAEASIDLEHADPSSACYQCHRKMDPMTKVFSNAFSINYHSKEVSTELQPSFTLLGVQHEINTIQDFAKSLADHPRFATAWLQKLCMWGNSTRCSESDPEFIRIAADFKDNGFKFNRLVREFFSSALFTGAENLKAHEDQKFIISRARSQRFCDAVNQRIIQIRDVAPDTGQPMWICTNNDDIGTVPKDAFDRAERDFITSTKIGVLDAKSIDVACANAANRAYWRVFGKDATSQESVTRAVELLMGVPNGHPRYQSLIDGLQKVYDIQTNNNVCSEQDAFNQDSVSCGFNGNHQAGIEAMFFAACTSPELLGVGF